ncbi:hypothetical protein U1Q18_011450 [Sarracenia purpurea var. burkii]
MKSKKISRWLQQWFLEPEVTAEASEQGKRSDTEATALRETRRGSRAGCNNGGQGQRSESMMGRRELPVWLCGRN